VSAISNAEVQALRLVAQQSAYRAMGLGKGAKRPGLVSVSTTHTEGGCVESLKVDHGEARFTRLQKGVGIAAKLQQAETQGRGYQVLFVTLTYRDGDDWRGTHLTAYMTRVRNHYRACTGDTLRYVWVGETQERGAIHYHVIFWVRRSYFMPKADKRGWWPHGMTKTEKARLGGGSVNYLMGYIKKQRSKEGLPHGARIFGVGGLSDAGRCVRRWVHMPAFLQARYDCRARVMRAPGGGWVDGDGTRWAPEWGVSAIGRGYTRLVRIRTYPPTGLEPVGPFSFLAGAAAA
jgi:hypothetical protein